MTTLREKRIQRSMLIMDAFPPDEPTIPIVGLSGEVVSATAVSTFRICRLCGALVLDSMTNTHIMVFDHSRES